MPYKGPNRRRQVKPRGAVIAEAELRRRKAIIRQCIILGVDVRVDASTEDLCSSLRERCKKSKGRYTPVCGRAVIRLR